MLQVIRSLLRITIIGLVTGACTSGSADSIDIPGVSAAEIEAVAAKRIVFAHQSVGSDILKGVETIARDRGVALHVAETRDVPALGAGIFHFQVGENGDPEAKLRDYRSALEHENWSGVDIAMVKLCYVDFNQDADMAALASSYIGTVDELQRRHPQTRFVAVTAPLTTVQDGPKAWIKRLLGKAPRRVPENARRQQFNELLRSRFDEQNLFDLAKLEATGAAPTRFRGNLVEVLNPHLSSDGGHLNDRGMALLGASFIKFVASTSPHQSAATN